MKKDQFIGKHRHLNINQAELDRKWRVMQEHEELQKMWEAAQLLNTNTSTSTAGGGGNGDGYQLQSGCIQFEVDTTEGTNFYFNFNTTGPINFTVDWGDGTTHEDSGTGGFYEETHEFPESDQQYTVIICFDDASIVTEFYSSND
jgi:hypothetical protein